MLLVALVTAVAVAAIGSCASKRARLGPASVVEPGQSSAPPRDSAASLGTVSAPALRLELNVPAFRLDVFRDTHRVRSYTVAVGLPDDQTPRGDFEISEVEWNPWWIPPKSDWAKNEKPEPPGPTNRVGRVKLRFLPLYLVHGTPFTETLGAARSRGCVRLSNRDAVDLALLVHEFASPELSDARLASVAADTATVLIPLAQPVSFAVRYELVEVFGDSAVFYPDVYEIGWPVVRKSVFTRLARARVDTSALDEVAIQALTARARRGRAVVALTGLGR